MTVPVPTKSQLAHMPHKVGGGKAVRAEVSGEYGTLVRAAQSTGILAGWPVEALSALETGTRWDSDTATNPAWYAQRGCFHEIGRFATPAGYAHTREVDPAARKRLPAPNGHICNSYWYRAQDPQAIAAYGGPIPTGPGDWKSDHKAQVCIGLVSLARDFQTACHKIPTQLAPVGAPNPWAFAILYWAFSAGADRPRALISRYPDLAHTPEASRWDALLDAIYTDIVAGWRPAGKPGTHGHPLWGVLRTGQKLARARNGGASAQTWKMPDPGSPRSLASYSAICALAAR
jgi:hypothetical protein